MEQQDSKPDPIPWGTKDRALAQAIHWNMIDTMGKHYESPVQTRLVKRLVALCIWITIGLVLLMTIAAARH